MVTDLALRLAPLARSRATSRLSFVVVHGTVIQGAIIISARQIGYFDALLKVKCEVIARSAKHWPKLGPQGLNDALQQ
jgi:uncharacterized protein (DUF697 family)